jgi:hypothetical protein
MLLIGFGLLSIFACEAEKISSRSPTSISNETTPDPSSSIETNIAASEGGQIVLGRSQINIGKEAYAKDLRVSMRRLDTTPELNAEQSAALSSDHGEVIAIEFYDAVDGKILDSADGLAKYEFEQSFETDDPSAQFGLVIWTEAGTSRERRILVPRASLEEVEDPKLLLNGTSEIRLRARIDYPNASLWFVKYQAEALDLFEIESDGSESNSDSSSGSDSTGTAGSGSVSSGGSGVATSSSSSSSSSSTSTTTGGGTDTSSTTGSTTAGSTTSGSGLTELTIFVTANAYAANFMTLATADGYCDNEAQAATLAGTYGALVAIGGDHPKDRITITDIPIYLPSGALVASNKAALWSGTIQNAVAESASATDQGVVDVWTGSLSDGSNDGGTLCGDWSNGSGFVSIGTTGATSSSWFSGMGTCSGSKRLYCIRLDQ